MILNDWEINHHGAELISPFRPERVQPASYDLALGNEFIVFDAHEQLYIDLFDLKDDSARRVTITDDRGFVLHPGEFVLGVTEERVTVPNNMVGRLDGKSTIGRTGTMIHITAGFVDPGWKGKLTLEICNVRKIPILLRPGQPFCQISFSLMTAAAEKPYQGRYQGADSVDQSRYAEEA